MRSIKKYDIKPIIYNVLDDRLLFTSKGTELLNRFRLKNFR